MHYIGCMKRPYADYQPDKLILRDWLAADRTVLANERTFLAYARTSLGSLITGISLIKLFEGVMAAQISGWAMIVLAGIIVIIGTRRFLTVRGLLHRIGVQPMTSLDDEQDSEAATRQ